MSFISHAAQGAWEYLSGIPEATSPMKLEATTTCSARWYALNRLINATLPVPLPVYSLLQRPVSPQERMGQEEREYADQQDRHEEPGIVQDRVFSPVFFLAVGIEFRKPRRGPGVALPAGGQDVLARKRGGRVRDDN